MFMFSIFQNGKNITNQQKINRENKYFITCEHKRDKTTLQVEKRRTQTQHSSNWFQSITVISSLTINSTISSS